MAILDQKANLRYSHSELNDGNAWDQEESIIPVEDGLQASCLYYEVTNFLIPDFWWGNEQRTSLLIFGNRITCFKSEKTSCTSRLRGK
jgi:hypothetical protein